MWTKVQYFSETQGVLNVHAIANRKTVTPKATEATTTAQIPSTGDRVAAVAGTILPIAFPGHPAAIRAPAVRAPLAKAPEAAPATGLLPRVAQEHELPVIENNGTEKASFTRLAFFLHAQKGNEFFLPPGVF